MINFKTLLIAGFAFTWASIQAYAEEETAEPLDQKWSFDGPFGNYDKEAMQHGFQIYKEVCSACHGIKRIRFRELAALGYNEAEIKAIASQYQIKDGPNDQGEMFERPGRPSDAFPSPYPNDQAARAANNGALPPDLSLVVKARKNGPNYIFSLLTGYGTEIPEGKEMPEGMHYNPWFPGGQIAMTPPLSDGLVTYNNGTQPSVDRMARDVVNFLTWASEPELERRKESGWQTLIYLIVFAGLMYIVMKRTWRDVK